MLHRALKMLRSYHQLKQIDLAKKLDISNSYLSEIESGEKTISVELLEKYSAIFDIPVSSIMLFSEQIDNNHKPGSRLKVAAANKILRLLEWIDERKSIKV